MIPIPHRSRRGRPSLAAHDDLAREVSQLPPGAAVERRVPSGCNPHTYRTGLRLAVAGRGIPCYTALIDSDRKVAIWPKSPVENFVSD